MSRMKVKWLLLTILILSGTSFASVSSKVPYACCPTTARYGLYCFFSDTLDFKAEVDKFEGADPLNPLFQLQANLCGYYLLQSIENKQVNLKHFKLVFEYWKTSYEKLCKKPFPILNIDNLDGLRTELLLTKTGQQFIRYPRISLQENESIKVRYPVPSLYAKNKNIELITASSPLYKGYRKCLRNENCSIGEEVALIDYSSPGFDWDRQAGCRCLAETAESYGNLYPASRK